MEICLLVRLLLALVLSANSFEIDPSKMVSAHLQDRVSYLNWRLLQLKTVASNQLSIPILSSIACGKLCTVEKHLLISDEANKH